MKSKAVLLYGKNNLKLEEIDLPEIGPDELLVKIVSDSICMSTWKAVAGAETHKRIPRDIAHSPIIIGHEFSGKIVGVGVKWKDKYAVGEKFSLQPFLNTEDNLNAPGYSYKNIGGAATYAVVPNEVLEQKCLQPYTGKPYYYGSLSEPYCCVINAVKSSYHTRPGSHLPVPGIKKGGNLLLLAGTGPMGFAALDYVLNTPLPLQRVVVTSRNKTKLDKMERAFAADSNPQKAVELKYVYTPANSEYTGTLSELSGKEGFDDIFVFAPSEELIETADSLLAKDGCLNFFAGPSDHNFTARVNFFNIHYNSTHVVGTSGGTSADMEEALRLFEEGNLNPSRLVTHIGGLNTVPESTLNLPNIGGGKKLIYTHLNLELTALSDFKKLGANDPFFNKLALIIGKTGGEWSPEAENFLLANGPGI